MPGWLCKIWQFMLGLVNAVLDIILAVVKTLVDFVVDVIEAVAEGVGGLLSNPLLLVAAGLALWYFLGKDDEGDDKPRASAAGSGASYGTY